MRLQGDVLASDMAAFKAANPGGCFADFVRWHSPKDWLSNTASGIPGQLSLRMSPEVGFTSAPLGNILCHIKDISGAFALQ